MDWNRSLGTEDLTSMHVLTKWIGWLTVTLALIAGLACGNGEDEVASETPDSEDRAALESVSL